MIRDRTQVEDNDETSEDDDDYEEPHKSLEVIIINLCIYWADLPDVLLYWLSNALSLNDPYVF